MPTIQPLDNSERQYIDILRGASVLRVVLMHLGLAWFYPPYSNYFGILFPVLFFVSGVVSYYSFQKGVSSRSYMIKRWLGIALPFYVIMLPIAIIHNGNDFILNVDFIMRWLLLRPTEALFPFPIGQIWFICTLLLLAIFSFPIFIAQRHTSRALLISLVISIIVSAVTTYEAMLSIEYIFPSFLSAYIVYETLSLAPFFLFGAYYIGNKAAFRPNIMTIVGVIVLLISLAVDITAKNYGYIEFSQLRPNTFIYQSLGVILLLLGQQGNIMLIFDNLPRIKGFLLHCNRHAYSIFIIHIPILVTLEYVLGWQDLSGNVSLAFIRLILVVILSLLIAVPVSSLHKYFTKKVTSLLK